MTLLHNEDRLIAGPERAHNALNASSSSPVWMYQSWAVQLAEDVRAFKKHCDQLQAVVDSLDPEYIERLTAERNQLAIDLTKQREAFETEAARYTKLVHVQRDTQRDLESARTRLSTMQHELEDRISLLQHEVHDLTESYAQAETRVEHWRRVVQQTLPNVETPE